MSSRAKKLVQAWLESPEHGVIELAHDWRARHLPPLSLTGGIKWSRLERVPPHAFGYDSAYFAPAEGRLMFFIRPEQYPDIDPAKDAVYLSGDFNGWAGGGRTEWLLVPTTLQGETVLAWSGPEKSCAGAEPIQFKFVTGDGRWLPVPSGAPNLHRNDGGTINRVYDEERTGRHLFQFYLDHPLDLSTSVNVNWQDGHDGLWAPLKPGAFFHKLGTSLPLGAIVRGTETTFRLFAPRARAVVLSLCSDLATHDKPHTYALVRRDDAGSGDGVWEVTLTQNLHGWFYWYHLDGPRDAFGIFDLRQRVLDPYALAAVDRRGPGIVLDREWTGKGDRSFKTPAWHDLVIVEAHVRDLAANAPVPVSHEQRRGFAGLRKWVESDSFYLHHLGVNCVELQPVQEFDNLAPDEYHWGYMTANYFAPESSYSADAATASGVRELQELVRAFHARGMAVVIDVVYNHVGEPAHLMFVDKLYYFEQDSAGALSNWSGCGNDLRTSATMATRLIIDSCIHLVETYGVDGFRFDLADLVGADVLRQVEVALKRVKPDVILIAEPWSFRGHIAGELRDTGWASWNDGYRNFLRDYVRGGATRDSFEYFLKGSPWYYAKWPAQTVNYTESHDDQTWIDVITENANGDGHLPTANDRRRTHLMTAVLFSSIGIPMISAGQDFLRSKHGVNNTYQRGDLNALDYYRIRRFPGTHAYFADWIAFRRSEPGRLMRHFSRATEGFFRFWWAEGSMAAAVVYNADLSLGPERLLLAFNPTLHDTAVPIDEEIAALHWRQLADHERFLHTYQPGAGQQVTPDLFVPALGCGLWICTG